MESNNYFIITCENVLKRLKKYEKPAFLHGQYKSQVIAINY